MMINYLITISAPPQAESVLINTAKFQDSSVPCQIIDERCQPQPRRQNPHPERELGRGAAARPRRDIYLTRTSRKAEDKICRQKGGNTLNKIPVLQNEPTDLDLSALDSTSDANEISTEPSEPTAHPDSLPRILRASMASEFKSATSDENGEISSGNYESYGLSPDYLHERHDNYAAKPTGLSELHLTPHLTEKLQNDPTEPAIQALNGRDRPLNGAPNRKKAEKTALMIYSGSSICFRPQRGAIES
jgi:hypothetical protein